MKLLINIISIHRKQEGEAHRDFQVHTAKISKDRIPTLVCLITNLMLSPGDLPNPGIEPTSPVLQVNSLPPAAAAAKLLQLCLTLCDPMNYSLPGSPVHGILQAGVLEWVFMPFSRGSSQPRE